MDDFKFAERIARNLYKIKLQGTSFQENWNDVPSYVQELWLTEAKRFISAANEAGIVLYEMDDHR